MEAPFTFLQKQKYGMNLRYRFLFVLGFITGIITVSGKFFFFSVYLVYEDTCTFSTWIDCIALLIVFLLEHSTTMRVRRAILAGNNIPNGDRICENIDKRLWLGLRSLCLRVGLVAERRITMKNTGKF